MRLIDADALKTAIGKETQGRNMMIGSGDVLDIIDEQPDVGAKTVRYARLIDDHCSICDKYVYIGDLDNYCPHCGARFEDSEVASNAVDRC